uniref:Uncharacterized protein n=1 Tax=Arundo donax TaxID=35708 RepID=A0A0A8ZHM0_ARUDO
MSDMVNVSKISHKLYFLPSQKTTNLHLIPYHIPMASQLPNATEVERMNSRDSRNIKRSEAQSRPQHGTAHRGNSRRRSPLLLMMMMVVVVAVVEPD